MSDHATYDVFLSHSSQDRDRVRDLAERLRRDGLRVWSDEQAIQAGDIVSRSIEDALESSRVLILAMSRHSLEREWAQHEARTFRFRDPTIKGRRFIPLRIDDVEIKDALKQFAYVDWRNCDESEYFRLLTACSPESGIDAVPESESLAQVHGNTIQTFDSPAAGVAVSEDGSQLLACSVTGRLAFWDRNLTQPEIVDTEHSNTVWGLACSRDGRVAFTCSVDRTIKVWSLEPLRFAKTIATPQATLWSVCASPDNQSVVSGSADGTLGIFRIEDGSLQCVWDAHSEPIYSVAVSADGHFIISASRDGTLRLWDFGSRRCLAILRGHVGAVRAVALNKDGTRAVSGGKDGTVRIWNLTSLQMEATLEGHTRGVRSVGIFEDGWRAWSGSHDNSCKLWSLRTGICLGTLLGHAGAVMAGASLTREMCLVTASRDRTVRMWDIQSLTEKHPSSYIPRYTNAKVLLVGESGVGKTGLAYRLTENSFKPTISTDAAWATQLRLEHSSSNGDIEREIWLWDFAGQADYRLIHQLFMDQTALAVLVFNPQSENPFEALGQWDRDLQRAARGSFRKLLVAARIDRGGLMLSRSSVERFRRERGFDAYLETSALTGLGCNDLRDAILAYIPWNDIPWTASPKIFRRLKHEILQLKDEGKILLRLSELKQQLELRLPNEAFTTEHLRAVVALLAGPGVVWQLEFGDFVLLQPERINAYAAAVIRSVRAHTEEIGCIREERVLTGDLDYQDMLRLPSADEQIVLRAMHQTFVDRGLCLREQTESGTLLIFPSYFKRRRPELEGHPVVLVRYQFTGPLEEIYATLIVRLHHTPPFKLDRLWQLAADFKTPSSKRLGLKVTRTGEGSGEMALYFEPDIAVDLQVMFSRYVHDHLVAKADHVTRVRGYVCPFCGEPVSNAHAIQRRLDAGCTDIICVFCERRVPLRDSLEEMFASESVRHRVRQMQQDAQAAINTQSGELVIEGHARAVAAEADQIYRAYVQADHGIDAEIEFKDEFGRASGRRIYLQLKSSASYTVEQRDGKELLRMRQRRWAGYWKQQAFPLMLVIQGVDRRIRWMNITDLLRAGDKGLEEFTFQGEPFTAFTLIRMRNQLLPKRSQAVV